PRKNLSADPKTPFFTPNPLNFFDETNPTPPPPPLSPRPQCPTPPSSLSSAQPSFVIRISSLIRISSFVIRHSPQTLSNLPRCDGHHLSLYNIPMSNGLIELVEHLPRSRV